MLNKVIKIATCCIITGSLFAEDIKLPKPVTSGGKPLMQTLQERKTNRNFSNEELTNQQLSNLLWAAWGFNRPEKEKRTAPSAYNTQDMELYIFLKKAVYLYDAKDNLLKEVIKGDGRGITGSQKFVKTAPVNLIYVSDQSKMVKMKTTAEKDMYSAIHTGLISQNVSLFCASEDLATVVRGWVDKEKVANVLSLPKTKKVILAQTVGKPAK